MRACFLLLWLILLIRVIPVCAQSSTDSLEGVLQRSSADTGRVRTLNLLIRQFEYTDIAKAAGYARESVALSRKLQDTYGMAVAYRLSGILAVDRSNLDEASRLYDTAGQLLSGQKDRRYQVQQALLLQNQSAVCQFREQYRQAVTLCLDAATLLAGLHEESYLFFCYNNLAVLYGYLEDKTSSLKYAQAAYDISAKYHDPFRIGMAGIELASTRMELKRYEGVKELLDESLRFATQFHNDYIAGTAYRLLSQYYAEDRQQPQEAIRTGLLALQYLTRTGNQVDLASTDQRLAVAFEEKGDHARAIRYQQEALAIGKKTGSLQIEKYSLLGLSEIAEKQHHFDQADVLLHRYIAVKDTIARQANERQINELEARYQMLRKEEEIGRLEAQGKISHLQINRQWILIGMLVGGIVVLIIIAGLVYANIRRRQLLQRQQIRELEKERQLVAVRSVLKGQEEERSRLARDLHDGVGGLLSGVKFSLSAMKGNVYLPEEQVQAFNQAVDQLDQSIGELRRVSHNMMPESLIKFGLTEALANYCENLNLSGKIRVQFQVYGLTQRPDPGTEVILYRMVQELLNNVIRHAGATTVLVQLMQEEDRFHLTVEDNGKGFDVQSAMDGRGAGLANVRARVDYLGGRLDIRSAPGEGTSVSVEGPLSTT